MKRIEVDIDSPKVRAFVQANAEVFRLAMTGIVEAAQDPEATQEENVALLMRATVAFAAGICKQFHISPDDFADLMRFFDEIKIVQPDSHRVRIPKDKLQ